MDDVHAADGVSVGKGVLLAGEGRRIRQQNRRVAALQKQKCPEASHHKVAFEFRRSFFVYRRTWTKQSWKKRRIKEAGSRGSLLTAVFTAFWTILWRFGQVDE